MVWTAWTAASMPDICPAQSCIDPAASCMSCWVICNIALAMIRHATSPIPIGRTPGFLSRAMRRQAKSGAVVDGSINSVQKRFAVLARDWHNSDETDLKDVHSLLHLRASSPDGPAAPLVWQAANMMASASRASKTIG